MATPLLIGFTGPSGVGKSTAAWILGTYGPWDILSFSTPIKDCVAAGLGITTLELEAIKRSDPDTARHWMRAIGDHVRMLEPDAYIRHARRRWLQSIYAASSVCLDDVRYDREAEQIRSDHGHVVHVRRAGFAFNREHSSELGIQRESSDLELENPGNMAGLRSALTGLLVGLQPASTYAT